MIALRTVDDDIIDFAILRAFHVGLNADGDADFHKKISHSDGGSHEKRLLSYAKPYRAATILAVICIVTEAFLELIIPMIMADMVDIGVANGRPAVYFHEGASDGGLRGGSHASGNRKARGLLRSVVRESARRSGWRNTESSSSFPFPIRTGSGPLLWSPG